MKDNYMTKPRRNLTILTIVSLLVGAVLGGLPASALAVDVYVALPYDLTGAGSTVPHISVLVKDKLKAKMYHNLVGMLHFDQWSTFELMKKSDSWVHGENNDNGVDEVVEIVKFIVTDKTVTLSPWECYDSTPPAPGSHFIWVRYKLSGGKWIGGRYVPVWPSDDQQVLAYWFSY